ncbi:hypothetical protein Clacol_007020 [Clathrus columnatus]|uniref:UDP-Glycosyltransferase/glycogen phosphorylase n=1 Tax=Clathrus columnatus TaxID=1419009 RepID=A0AAV5ALI4_9AGAM|nr:hypothetical protein Clacol_007020 [Clathrus columnatus]
MGLKLLIEGHLRPAVAVAIKLLKEKPDLIITFPIPLNLQQDLLDHIKEYFIDGKDDTLQTNLRKRTRIIPLGPCVHRDKNFYTLVEEFEPFYTDLISSKPYIAKNGMILDSIRPPDICMMDRTQALHSEALRTVHRITENIPVFVFSFSSTSLTLRILLRGDVPAQAERLSKETGRPIDEILMEFYQPNKGQVIDIPGLPSMYDYEVVPHLSPVMLAFYLKMGSRSYDSFQNCSGIITTSNWVYESQGTRALEKYLSETNRPLYVLGPLGLITPEQLKESSEERTATAFLDGILTKRGKQSLIYVSFGSLFWPPNPEAVWKILEILLERNIPILLSYNNQKASMPEALHSTLTLSENAFITPWAPQNAVLQHPVTGWFLTHCGQNSVMEALSNGIPMIAWPIDTDQPLNAAYMSTKLHVAYELIEVRTKNGLKPLHRGITPRGTMEAVEEEFRGILEKLWSSDGQAKREDAQEIQRKFSTLWDEDGESRKDLRRFISDHLS